MQELHGLITRPRRRHQDVHLRRRHARRRAPQGARGRPHRRHQPGHAAHRHPAAPHEVGEAVREPALRRHRRAAPVPRRLRQPRRERRSAGCAASAASTAPTRSSSAARRRSPTRASSRRASCARPIALVDDNGAPRGRKVVAVYNPPVVNRELGIRESAVGRRAGDRRAAAAARACRRSSSRRRACASSCCSATCARR